jgi:CBS domain-containing protein
MPIEKVLSRPAETLPPGASCRAAAILMREEGVGSIVVAEELRPLGVVTDRDLVVRVMAEGLDPEKTPLRDVMSGDPIFVSGARGLDEVISAMRNLAVRRVPVVDEKGHLAGVVSMDDLVVLLADQLGDLAEAIRAELGDPR